MFTGVTYFQSPNCYNTKPKFEYLSRDYEKFNKCDFQHSKLKSGQNELETV